MTTKDKEIIRKAITNITLTLPDLIISEIERIEKFDKELENCTLTKEDCYAVAMKYNSKHEFSKKAPVEHMAAVRNGWISDYTWFERTRSWDFDSCKKEAAKYRSKKEFHLGSTGAYLAAVRHKWIDKFPWIEGRRKWDYDTCKEYAKKCGTKSEFAKKYPNAYMTAINNGWLNTFDVFTKGRPYQRSRNFWSKEMCLIEATKYKSKSEFARQAPGAYAKTLKTGWIDEIEWHRPGKYSDTEWTEEMCRTEAEKYGSKTAFMRNCPEAFYIAKKNGWVDSYNFNRPKPVWTEEKCREEASKYDTPTQFLRKAQPAYYAAKKNGWLNDFVWKKKNIKWDESQCKKEAEKYDTMLDFSRKAPSAYCASKKHGWIDDYTWLKKKNNSWSFEKCLSEAIQYPDKTAFQKGSKNAYLAVIRNNWMPYMQFDKNNELDEIL